MNIYIMNSLICLPDSNRGVFEVREISREDAILLLQSTVNTVVSAVGHEATAQVLTELLGIPVTTNRIEVKFRPGDAAIVLKLNGRLPEGKVISSQEMEKIGYKLYLVRCI